MRGACVRGACVFRLQELPSGLCPALQLDVFHFEVI